MDASQVTILNLNEALSRKSLAVSDTSSTQENTNSSSESTVSFAQAIQTVEPTLHRCDYTIPERRATWYDPLEIRSLKAKRTRILKLMDEQGDLVSECTRGLESKTKEGARLRSRNMMNAVSAVLNEQENQDTQCSPDPEALANAYKMYARHCEKEALERAAADQEEASLSAL